MKIAELEQDKNWQATAEDKNLHRIAILRADAGLFHLYDGNWTATAYSTEEQYPKGRPTHTTDEVKAMFAAGKLKLVKGRIPD